MVRSVEEAATERKAYVDRMRASFYSQEPDRGREQGQEGEPNYSSLGIRTAIAVLIFAAFVYCDQKQITFHQYKTEDVWKQIAWNPLPLEELEDAIKISLESNGK